jgi:molybdopterin-guanine dinucleotide biosynthesis protein A
VVAGILLTGGASRRMGADKASLVLDGLGGATLAVRAARVLAGICDPVVEVGPGATDLPALREEPPGRGPLAAVVAGADALGVVPVVVLACDMPFVDERIVEFVANHPAPADGAVVVLASGRAQYGCARYGTVPLERARAALARDERSFARTLGDDESVVLVPEDEWRAATGAPAHAFADVDTPADLERFGLRARR